MLAYATAAKIHPIMHSNGPLAQQCTTVAQFSCFQTRPAYFESLLEFRLEIVFNIGHYFQQTLPVDISKILFTSETPHMDQETDSLHRLHPAVELTKDTPGSAQIGNIIILLPWPFIFSSSSNLALKTSFIFKCSSYGVGFCYLKSLTTNRMHFVL